MGEWKRARKKPVWVEFKGPFTEPNSMETLEGKFNIDRHYLEQHGAYVIVRGVDGETYPVAIDIFERTYEVLD